MGWQLILLSTIWLGYEIVSLFAPPIWDIVTIISVGIPFGITITTWIFYCVRLIFPLNAKIGYCVCALISTSSIFLHYSHRHRIQLRKISPEFIILLISLFILFVSITDISYLRDGNISSGTVFSDLPVHMGIATSLAYGANSLHSDMHTPFYSSAKLSYPLIPDFFSSILIQCGNSSLRTSFTVPTVLNLLAFVVILHQLGIKFSKTRFVPELTVILWFFSGGMGWRFAFEKRCRENFNVNFSHLLCFDRETFWMHPFIHFLMPQRSACFSMPLVTALLSLLGHMVLTNYSDRKSSFLAGILMGVLPMISAHSFIAVGLYALGICIINFPWKEVKKWFSTVYFWALYGVTAILIAIPQILFLSPTKRKDFMKIDGIWNETHDNPIQMWWNSLGIFIVLALFGVWPLLTDKQKILYFSTLPLFIISNILLYQPGAMDNNKVFFAGWYPIACASVAQFLVTVWNNSNIFRKAAVIILSFCIFLSSWFTISLCFTHTYQMWNDWELAVAKYAMQYTPREAVFLSSQWHANPIMSISGRLIYMGYGGWVWTHGLELWGRVDKIRNMTRNIETENFRDENIKYTLVRFADQKDDFDFPNPSMDSQWNVITENPAIKMYRIINPIL